MKRLISSVMPRALVGVILLGAGCEPKSSVKTGAPELTSFQVIDPSTGGPIELTGDAAVASVPPRVRLLAVFDRILDGPAIELVSDGGVSGRPGVATISATPMSPTADVVYFPNGAKESLIYPLLGVPLGPSLTINPNPTLPAGATITVTLDKTKVRSKAGEPFTGEGPLKDGVLTFQTDPLAAAFAIPERPDPGTDAGTDDDAAIDAGLPVADVDADLDALLAEAGAPADDGGAPEPPTGPSPTTADAHVNVSFNNLMAETTAAMITVSRNGTALPAAEYTVTPDMMDPTVFVVAPATTWTAGATFTVTVAAEAADVMGSTLGSAASASFIPAN
jgi:hypothetical protein